MANEVTIKIKVKDESAAGYDQALASARKFGAELHEELERAGKEGGKNAGEEAAEELGDKLKEEALPKVEEFSEKFKEKLDETGKKAGEKGGKSAADSINRALRELNLPELDVTVRTEDAKIHIDALKANLIELGRDNPTIEVKVKVAKALAEIEAFKKLVDKQLGDVKVNFGQKIQQGLQKIDFGPSLATVGSAIVVALAPLLGAGIAGLIVGGAGLGGIVGGVIVAAKDARVKSALQDLKKDVGDSLKVDAAPFVPVVLSGIKELQGAFHAIDFKGIFADLAPQVQPVLSGIVSLLVSLGDSIKNIAANSGPVLQELGNDFRSLGNTLAQGLNSLTDNSKQEAQALHDLFGIIDGGIALVFGLVNALTEMYGVYRKIQQLSLEGIYEQLSDGNQKVTDSIKVGIGAATAQIDANSKLAGSAAGVAAANKREADSIKSVSDSLKAATDPAFALEDATSKLKTAQDKYNTALKQHGTNSKQAKSAQKDLEGALIDYLGAASNARSGTGHLTQEQKDLLKAAHASAGTIQDLDNRLQDAYKQAKKLDGFEVHIGVQTKYTTIGDPGDQGALHGGLAHGGISGAASGATSSGLTWVGERGPELIHLPPGTSVRTNGDSERLVSRVGAAAGAGDGYVGTLRADTSNMTGLIRAIMETLRAEIRVQGGHVQTVLGVGAQ